MKSALRTINTTESKSKLQALVDRFQSKSEGESCDPRIGAKLKFTEASNLLPYGRSELHKHKFSSAHLENPLWKPQKTRPLRH